MDLSFRVGPERVDPRIDRLILAAFAGRSEDEVAAHIAEMARQGVPPPPATPLFWPVLPHLLTQDIAIAVYGPDTIPEVEYVLFTWHDVLYVTVGNDQCDIEVESKLSGEKSKNLCQKVLAREAWRVADVLPHWDELRLTLMCDGTIMQQDNLAALLRPEMLMEKVAAVDGNRSNGRMIFSGTIAASGAYPPNAYSITMRLTDPVWKRDISHEFTVTTLVPFY